MNFYAVILILKMEENMQHFRHIMLYYFKKGKNVTKRQKNREGAVADQTCQTWFTKILGTIDILGK